MIYKLKKRCKLCTLTSQSCCITTTLDKFNCIATFLKLQMLIKGDLLYEIQTKY